MNVKEKIINKIEWFTMESEPEWEDGEYLLDDGNEVWFVSDGDCMSLGNSNFTIDELKEDDDDEGFDFSKAKWTYIPRANGEKK